MGVLAGCLPAAPLPEAWDLVLAAPAGAVSDAAQAAADAYARETGLRVSVQTFPGDAYPDRVSATLLAGTGEFDLVYLPAESLPKWVDYHMLLPLDLPGDENIAPWLPPVTVEGAVYGVPTQPDADVLWYRADLFDAAGVSAPSDWKALTTAISTIKQPPESWPLAVSAGEMDAGRDLTALLGHTEWIEESSTGWRVDSDALADAINNYAGWQLGTSLVHPKSNGWTRVDVQNALGTGKAAMGILHVTAAEELLDCEQSEEACKDGAPLLAFAPLPGLEDGLGVASVQAWAVPLKAPHADAAQDFARWLASDAGARAWALGGGLPAHQGVLAEMDSPAAQALAQVEQIRPAFPPLIPADAIWRALNIAGHGAAQGEPPEALAEEMVQSIQTALRQSGYTVIE